MVSKATGCRSVSRSVRLLAGQPWVEISNVVDKLPLVEKDGIHFGFAFNLPDSKTRVDIPQPGECIGPLADIVIFRTFLQ